MAHWYDKEGNTAYKIVGANGKERDTTLRDARKFGYVPSVTTIIGQLDKPWLNMWKQNKMLEACWQHNEGQFLDFTHYKEELIYFIKSNMELAPTLGTAVHDELEQWYKSGVNTPPNDRIAKAVFAVREQVGKFDYKAEESFCCKLGFGGKIDLISSNDNIVIDFKTKNTDDPKKMIHTNDYAMQLAAYRIGINCYNARCFNVYISTVDFNIVKVVEYKEEDLQTAWNSFKCLLKFWQLSNGIKPEIECVI